MNREVLDHNDELYQEVCRAAASLAQKLSWLEAVDSEVGPDGESRSLYRMTVEAEGVAAATQLDSLIGALRARIEELRQLQDRLRRQLEVEADVRWLEEVPVRELVRRGYLPPIADQARLSREALAFFGVDSAQAWRSVWGNALPVLFRRSDAVPHRPGLVASWLRMGELAAELIRCQPYDEERFRLALQQIRGFSCQRVDQFVPAMKQRCAEAGVAVVFVQEIPRAGVNGATRWLSQDKALIQLSLRYKTDDLLWFNFFHEAGHILLHGRSEMFLEGEAAADGREREADAFAADMLIPPDVEQLLHCLDSDESIEVFARLIGVAPGIVVGRLQHEGLLPYSRGNALKRKLRWTDEQSFAEVDDDPAR